MGLLDSLFGKKAPALSDPNELVRREGLENRANITSPFGSRTITRDPSGRAVVNLQESDLASQLRGLQGERAKGFFGNTGDFGREATEKAIFERGSSLLAPGRERERRRLETSLSLKGLPIGSEAFAGAEERLRMSEGEQDRQLALQSILGAGAESRAERGQQMAEISPFLQTQAQEQGFLQGQANLQPISVASIFQQADAQKLARNAQENQRRQNRFSSIAGAISTAFTPTGITGQGASPAESFLGLF
jgi:hypothetical protein